MSRAELFLAWWVDLFTELIAFFRHYYLAGIDIWSLGGVLAVLTISWMWFGYKSYKESLGEKSLFDRLVETVLGGLFLGSGCGVLSLIPLSLLLGFLFGPIRP